MKCKNCGHPITKTRNGKCYHTSENITSPHCWNGGWVGRKVCGCTKPEAEKETEKK